MTVSLKREGKYFFMVDENGYIPITREAYLMAVKDNIREVRKTGYHPDFPYGHVLDVLEGLLEDVSGEITKWAV